MAEAVNPEKIIEAVAVDNLKAIGGGTAFLANLAHANAVANQQVMNGIMNAAAGKIIESIIATSPSEGGADLAALQQIVKAAQSTPPVTG